MMGYICAIMKHIYKSEFEGDIKMIRLQEVKKEERELLWNINQKYQYERQSIIQMKWTNTEIFITNILMHTLLMQKEKPFSFMMIL